MPNRSKPINEGYIPTGIRKDGYQPNELRIIQTDLPDPQTGYTPTGTGDNSTDLPEPPGDE